MSITGKTAVYAVIGDPVEHSLSPLMHNRAIRDMGLDAVYVPFHVRPESLGSAIAGMRAFGIDGLNVTVPHKTAVMEYLDEISGDAKAVGAVNTVIVRDGRLIGDNTDGYGFLKCLESGGLSILPERICLIGAGGAARGVGYACAMRGEVKEIVILNRTVSKAVSLAYDIATLTGKNVTASAADEESFEKHVPASGLVVNTTSVGMFPNEGVSPVPDPAVFREGQYVADIVYVPLRTKFLDDAASRGANIIEGLAMLAWQGARSLSLWTGADVAGEIMMEALNEHFNKGQ